MGGDPGCNLKEMEPFSYPLLMYLSIWQLTLVLNIFIIVATVPTGLQTYAKILQMHFSGGGGTPWLQPKRNGTF